MIMEQHLSVKASVQKLASVYHQRVHEPHTIQPHADIPTQLEYIHLMRKHSLAYLQWQCNGTAIAIQQCCSELQ